MLGKRVSAAVLLLAGLTASPSAEAAFSISQCLRDARVTLIDRPLAYLRGVREVEVGHGFFLAHQPGSIVVDTRGKPWLIYIGNGPEGDLVAVYPPKELIEKLGGPERAKLMGVERVGNSERYRFKDRDALNDLARRFNEGLPPDSPDRMLVTFYDAPAGQPLREVLQRYVDGYEWPLANGTNIAVHDATLHGLANLQATSIQRHARDCVEEALRFMKDLEASGSPVTKLAGWKRLEDEAGSLLDGVMAPVASRNTSGFWINGFDLSVSPEKMVERMIRKTSVHMKEAGAREEEILLEIYERYVRRRSRQGQPVSDRASAPTAADYGAIERKLDRLQSIN